MYITASKLYDYIKCPHRVWRDVYGPQKEKDQESNPFVELLWEKGVKHEENIIRKIGDYLDLSEGELSERNQRTLEALNNGIELIYQGVIQSGNLLGIPDLLQKQPDGSYIAIDIKSGRGLEGVEDEDEDLSEPKKHYAVQLCLYNQVLRELGFSNHFQGKIIDIDEKIVLYKLDEQISPRNKQTFVEYYQEIKTEVEKLIANQAQNSPANSSSCKLCPWYNSCQKWVEKQDDMSRVFYVGRSVRDKLFSDLDITTSHDLCELDLDSILSLKKEAQKDGDKDFLKGLGDKSISKMITRARILNQTKRPVLYERIEFPRVDYELFFDIEDDPTQDFVYLHGVYERNNATGQERFVDFTAKEIPAEAEKEAWVNFWQYIHSLPENNFAVYYYSPHEKSTYKRMQKKYPDVISEEEVADFFENPNVIDLYNDVVLKKTDWPVGSYGIKSLAVYCGFHWRDETPSGALSIQWFNEYIETKDEDILKRILEYNEDDCKATMVVKDEIERLSDEFTN